MDELHGLTLANLHSVITVITGCCACPCNATGLGFTRVNLLSTTPEDITNTLNCIHSIIQRHQREAERAEEAVSDVRRLRNDLQVADQMQSKLRKDLETKERDVGGLLIKVSVLMLSSLWRGVHCRCVLMTL